MATTTLRFSEEGSLVLSTARSWMLHYVDACNSIVQARALLESIGIPHYSLYTLALSHPPLTQTSKEL